MVCASIVLLFQPCSPAAILRGIAKIVVDAVDTVIRGGARPHIGVETIEGFKPTVAHGNAPAPIASISGVMRIGAPLLHAAPNTIFARLGHAMLMQLSVGVSLLFPGALTPDGLIGSQDTFKTPTALRVAANQGFAGGDGFVSAVANYFPAGLALYGIRRGFGAANDGPHAKPLAGHIYGTINALCDRIDGHRNLLGCGVKGRDVSASPAYLFAEPYYITFGQFRKGNGALIYGT